MPRALAFAVGVWLAAPLPLLVANAISIKLHPPVVAPLFQAPAFATFGGAPGAVCGNRGPGDPDA